MSTDAPGASDTEAWRGVAAEDDEEVTASAGLRLQRRARALVVDLVTPHRRPVALAVALLVLENAVMLAGPLLVALAIDTGVPAALEGRPAPLGRPSATREEVVAAAEAVGARGFVEALPEGFDTDVRKRGGRLSAGQRQLVSLARVVLAAPAVVLLDEATSSLDVPSERAVQEALETVLAGRTALIIAHRLSTVLIADRVLIMADGVVVQDGSPADLLAGEGEFAALHAAWLASLA